jgi:hypothetical protein
MVLAMELRCFSCLLQVVPAIDHLTSDGAQFTDGQVQQFDAIILATGYRSNVPQWLHVSFFLLPKLQFSLGGVFFLGEVRGSFFGLGDMHAIAAQFTIFFSLFLVKNGVEGVSDNPI